MSDRKMQSYLCAGCGVEFVRRSDTHAKYCSRSCSAKGISIYERRFCDSKDLLDRQGLLSKDLNLS